MSLKYSKLLDSYVDWTDEEILAKKKYLKWEELTINWEKIDLLWEEIFILLEVEGIIKRGGGYGAKEYEDGNPWKQVRKELGEEKEKILLKLYCRVNGIDYEKTVTEKKEIKVTVGEFERFVKEAVSIKIGFEK
jgi:hypothetical protein